jgi:hypothetical protein
MDFARLRRILSWVLRSWPRRSSRRNPIEEIHAFFAERLTESGKAVAGLWLGSLVLAMLPWHSSSLFVFALLTSVLAFSLGLTFRAPSLRATPIGQGQAVEGTTVEWRVRLENLSGRRVDWGGVGLFRAREGMDASIVESLAEEIPAGGSVDLVLHAGCLSRGPSGYMGIGVVRRDAFGLARARAIDFSPVEIDVAPAPLRVVWDRFLFQGASGRAFADAAGFGGDAERIFHGVRPFREGDRLRDLDHKSWARWNQPIVREFAETPPRGIVLSVETCCDDLLERSLLEPMARLAAGVADKLCREGGLARLVVDGRMADVRCDEPDMVQSVFASLPRCGWGRWPKSSKTSAWSDPSSCVLWIGVAQARWGTPPTGTRKRVAVVARRREVGEDPDLARVDVASIETGEVSL